MNKELRKHIFNVNIKPVSNSMFLSHLQLFFVEQCCLNVNNSGLGL